MLRLLDMFHQEMNRILNLFLPGVPSAIRFAHSSDLPGSSRQREQLVKQRLKTQVLKALQAQGVDAVRVNMSVSHTSWDGKSWVLVLGAEAWVGVDLECRFRKVLPAVLSRITSAQERECFDWDVLQFWVIKEAAFKSNPQNQGTLIPQYQIKTWDALRQEGEIILPQKPDGQLTCRFRYLELDRWCIALACTGR